MRPMSDHAVHNAFACDCSYGGRHFDKKRDKMHLKRLSRYAIDTNPSPYRDQF